MEGSSEGGHEFKAEFVAPQWPGQYRIEISSADIVQSEGADRDELPEHIETGKEDISIRVEAK